MSNLFERAKIDLIFNHPFFSSLVLQMPIKAEPSIPTAGVNGKDMFYNEEWVSKMNDKERVGLLTHEVLHLALGHMWRVESRNKEGWNMAADIVINQLLEDAGLTLPKVNGVKTSFNVDFKQFKGMCVEEVYAKIPKPKEVFVDVHIYCDGSGTSDKGEKGGKGTEGQGKDGDGKILSIKMTKEEMTKAENAWKITIAQAGQVAKMKGNLPAGMDRFIEGLLSPKVHWTEVFKYYLNEILKDDYSLMRPDRRFVSHGIYLPDLWSEGCSVALAIDSSGSMDEDTIRECVSESMAIFTSRSVSRVRIMVADADVHYDKTFIPGEHFPTKFVRGGGGTSFVPVFDRLNKSNLDSPSVLIYFTDTFGDFPDYVPNYPVIIVTRTKDAEVPNWVRTIVINT